MASDFHLLVPFFWLFSIIPSDWNQLPCRELSCGKVTWQGTEGHLQALDFKELRPSVQQPVR